MNTAAEVMAHSGEVVLASEDVVSRSSAAEEISEQLETDHQTRAIAELEARRCEVRQILRSRIEGQTVAKVLEATQNLSEALRMAHAENEHAYLALRNLDPSRDREWRQISRSHSVLVRTVAKQLQGLIPVDSREVVSRALWGLDARDEDRRTYARITEALDRLELVF